MPLPKYSFAEVFLSFFTSPGRAASIAGDLAEESQGRRFRFWRQVIGTAVSLGFRQLGTAPVQLLLLLLAGNIVIDWTPKLTLEGVRNAFANWSAHAVDPQALTLKQLLLTRVAGSLVAGLILAALSRGREVMVCTVVALSRPILFLVTWLWFSYPLTWTILMLNSVSPLLLISTAVCVRRLNLQDQIAEDARRRDSTPAS